MTMKVNSRRTQIIDMFKKFPTATETCQGLTRHFVRTQKLEPHTARYLSGSISSILRKLVKDGILEYSEKKTPRGGHIYKLKQK